MAVQGVLASVDQADRTLGLHGKQSHVDLGGNIVFASKPATDGSLNDPHLVHAQGQCRRYLAPVAVGVLGGRDDGEHAGGVYVGQSGFGLHRHVVHQVGPVGPRDESRTRLFRPCSRSPLRTVVRAKRFPSSWIAGEVSSSASSMPRTGRSSSRSSTILLTASSAACSVSAATQGHRVGGGTHFVIGQDPLV